MSTTTYLDRIMKNARTHLPSAMDDVLKIELFSVLDEFLRNTSCWKEEISVNVITTKLLYEIEAEEATTSAIVRLMWLQNSNEVPVDATMAVPGELLLRTLPSQAETLTATVALTVDDPVTSTGYPKCPSWVLSNNLPCLVDGLLGKMMSHPAKPYASERLAIYHLRRFRDAMNTARAAAAQTNRYSAQPWRFPSFGK